MTFRCFSNFSFCEGHFFYYFQKGGNPVMWVQLRLVCPSTCWIIIIWKFIGGSLMRLNWTKLANRAQNTWYFNCFLFLEYVYCSQMSFLLEYSRLSLSRRESLEHFEISVPRNISCRSEENNRSNKWICNLTPEVRDILKILWKRGEIAP